MAIIVSALTPNITVFNLCCIDGLSLFLFFPPFRSCKGVCLDLRVIVTVLIPSRSWCGWWITFSHVFVYQGEKKKEKNEYTFRHKWCNLVDTSISEWRRGNRMIEKLSLASCTVYRAFMQPCTVGLLVSCIKKTIYRVSTEKLHIKTIHATGLYCTNRFVCSISLNKNFEWNTL